MTGAISTLGKGACCFSMEAWVPGATCSSEVQYDQRTEEGPLQLLRGREPVLSGGGVFRDIVVRKSSYRR